MTLRSRRLKTNDVADPQCSGEVDASVQEEKDELMTVEDVTCERNTDNFHVSREHIVGDSPCYLDDGQLHDGELR